MKKFLLILLIANLQFGCVSTVVGPQGFRTSANMTMVSWTPTSFTATSINSSTPDNSIWRGANKLAATVASAGIAIAVPGTGAVPAITRGVGVVAPHINTLPSETLLTK